MIVILVLGIVAALIGLVLLAAPRRATAFEHRVNSDQANAGIPGFWQGRMNTRMRLGGVIFLVCGVLIVVAAFVGSHQHH